MPIPDHPQRYATVNELHARPFPAIEVPATAVYVAIKEPSHAQNRDRARDRAHLLALLDRHGSAHPQPGATHFQGPIGRAELKWESHTEFVTYTAFTRGVSARPFDPAEAEVMPEDWLAEAPGRRLTSILIRVEPMPASEEELLRRVDGWVVPESLAVARVVDGAAVTSVAQAISAVAMSFSAAPPQAARPTMVAASTVPVSTRTSAGRRSIPSP